MDELKDVYSHFLLYYGRDIPKMQNAAKANRKKLKRVREEGDEEGECWKGKPMRLDGHVVFKDDLGWVPSGASLHVSDPWEWWETKALTYISLLGEGEEAEDEEQRGPELKQASRRDMYTICQSAGLGKS